MVRDAGRVGGDRLAQRLGPGGERLADAGGGGEHREEREQASADVDAPAARYRLPHAASAARSSAAGSGRRNTTRAAASAGSTATATASGIVCGRSSSVTGGGTGACAVAAQRDGGHEQPGDDGAEHQAERGRGHGEQQLLQEQLRGGGPLGDAERGQQRVLRAPLPDVRRDRHPEAGDREQRRRGGHGEQRLLRRGRQRVARSRRRARRGWSWSAPGGSAARQGAGTWPPAVASHHWVTASGWLPWLTRSAWSVGRSMISAGCR